MDLHTSTRPEAVALKHTPSNVIPITSEPVRSDLARVLDSTYETVNGAAKAFMARGNQKVAARLALVSFAVLAASDDGEWNAMHLHGPSEAAIDLKRAAMAAKSAIELLLLSHPDGETRLKDNVVLRFLCDAIEKADKAGIR